MNDLVMEAVACLRHGSEEARVGVEPELKRSATRELKVRARRASSAAWAVQYVMRREPPEPRIDGTVLSAARRRVRRLGEVVRERSLEQAAKVWSEPLTVLY